MKACAGAKNLQMMLMNRFCKFQKDKTVNYHMQVERWQAGYIKVKGLRWGSPGKWTKYIYQGKFF